MYQKNKTMKNKVDKKALEKAIEKKKKILKENKIIYKNGTEKN